MIDFTLKNANILIIDDQQSNIDILLDLLEIHGYINIKYTTDPRLAIGLYKSFKPDLILLDIKMPYFTGYEVMNMIKEIIPKGTYLPILVLTADISVKAKQLAMAGGAKDFLTKPFDLTEVDLRIKNLLETLYLHQQLENQNQILEVRVKERTFELEKSNTELIAAKEKAESSDRLKTAFLRNISHEIRTPLNGILGFGVRLARRELTPEKKEEYLAILQSSSDRLASTVTNYLDIALIISGNLEVKKSAFDPGILLTEIYNSFIHSCKAKNLTLKLQIPSSNVDFQMISDPVLLQKAISHLIDNAIKFTKHGAIAFGFEKKMNELEFFVQDTGIGISSEAETIIYDLFMQADDSSTRSYEGNGLGLSIAKNIVKTLGGHIWFRSVKDEGTNFYFTIPLLC